MAERVGFEPTYRLLTDNSISSRARYGLFATFPQKCVVHEVPSAGKPFFRYAPGLPLPSAVMAGAPTLLRDRLSVFPATPVHPTPLIVRPMTKTMMRAVLLSIFGKAEGPPLPDGPSARIFFSSAELHKKNLMPLTLLPIYQRGNSRLSSMSA